MGKFFNGSKTSQTGRGRQQKLVPSELDPKDLVTIKILAAQKKNRFKRLMQLGDKTFKSDSDFAINR